MTQDQVVSKMLLLNSNRLTYERLMSFDERLTIQENADKVQTNYGNMIQLMRTYKLNCVKLKQTEFMNK